MVFVSAKLKTDRSQIYGFKDGQKGVERRGNKRSGTGAKIWHREHEDYEKGHMKMEVVYIVDVEDKTKIPVPAQINCILEFCVHWQLAVRTAFKVVMAAFEMSLGECDYAKQALSQACTFLIQDKFLHGAGENKMPSKHDSISLISLPAFPLKGSNEIRANTLFNIWVKYKPRLPEWYYNEKLLKVGDSLAQIKEYKLALLQCYGRYLQQFVSVNLDDIVNDVHQFKSTFFPNGIRDKNAAHTMFARRGLIKIDELKQLENISSSLENSERKKIFREATLKMSVMIFKRAVYESRRKPKSSFRPKLRVSLKEIQNLSWPRTTTERLLTEMFDGAAAQFLAILEALSDSSRHVLRPAPPVPDETEIHDVISELFLAGLEILSGGVSSTGIQGNHCSDHFGIINASSTLLQLILTGERGVSGDAAVKFIKLAFSYEEWDVFDSAIEFVVNFLQAQDDLKWKKAEVELKLLTLVQPILFPSKLKHGLSISESNTKEASMSHDCEKRQTSRKMEAVTLRNDNAFIAAVCLQFKKSPTEQLQVAYESLENAINGMNTCRLMTLLPDGKSIFDSCCTKVDSTDQNLNSVLGCGNDKTGTGDGFVMDLHLELIQAQHRVAVKLLKMTQEALIMRKIKKNKLSRAIYLMQKATQKFPEELTTSSQKKLLEVSWYSILGCVAEGSNVKVRLNNNKLRNAGEEIPADGKSLLEIQGLDPNEKYIFAVAAYSSDGKLIGDAIGEATQPILAYPPLSVTAVRAYLTQAAYQTGNYTLAREAFSPMWDYFVSSPLPTNAGVVSASINLTTCENRLCFEAVSQTSPITLHLFLRSLFAVCDINVMERGLFCDSIFSSEILYKEQVARLAECERMAVAIELSNWLNDASYTLQSVVQCYGLLAPIIYHKISSVPVVQILIKCLAVLQEIPSATLQRKHVGCYESVQHMIACTSFYTAKKVTENTGVPEGDFELVLDGFSVSFNPETWCPYHQSKTVIQKDLKASA
ncbi:Cfap54 [Columba livia]|nr:Cfap54 [Columba livia]